MSFDVFTAPNQNQAIFHAVKAGTWYPAQKSTLQANLQEYLNKAKIELSQKPRIIIVPHPGLVYGGPTAAYAYKAISSFKYRNIFIVATSHVAFFKEIVVGDFIEYQTPFGNIMGNRDISSFMMYKNQNFIFNKSVLEQEHSLEMQLPWIKYLTPQSQIIPMVISGENYKTSEILAEMLYQAITPDDLVIISTDLSHYPAYADAQKIDKQTLNGIVSGSAAKFIKEITDISTNFPANTSTAACGAIGVAGGLYLAEKLGLGEGTILHYENSGDRPIGDKHAVVGYGAVAFWANDSEKFSETIVLNAKEKETLLLLARETIALALEGKKIEMKLDKDSKSLLNKPYGAFVTLTINEALRGCIGNFEPAIPLIKVVQEMAISAAFKDPRFSPLTKEEFKDIHIEISVLSPRKSIKSYKEIIPGKHGVYVQKGYMGGTYLPQVAPDQGWNREEMLISLCAHKSGMDAKAWYDGSAELSTYTANVFKEN